MKLAAVVGYSTGTIVDTKRITLSLGSIFLADFSLLLFFCFSFELLYFSFSLAPSLTN